MEEHSSCDGLSLTRGPSKYGRPRNSCRYGWEPGRVGLCLPSQEIRTHRGSPNPILLERLLGQTVKEMKIRLGCGSVLEHMPFTKLGSRASTQKERKGRKEGEGRGKGGGGGGEGSKGKQCF